MKAMGRVLSNCCVLLAAFFWVLAVATSIQEGNWINHGGDLRNRRYGSKEVRISPKTVKNLSLKWKFEGEGDITATPAIYKGVVYFPSWDGYVYAVKACDGSLVWKQFLQNLTGIAPTGRIVNVNATVARATPTIAKDLGLLILGVYGPAVLLALRVLDGSLVWMTTLDHHNNSIITMSGTYYDRAFYVGVSSQEEGSNIEQCCTFRGSFVKVEAKTGRIIWRRYMLPDNKGQRGEYAGAAVWGSSPSIDVFRNSIYIATGNLYSAPQRVLDCQRRLNNQTILVNPDDCIEPDNHSNSILALDLDKGNIKWFRQLGGYDIWLFACSIDPSNPSCPPGPSPDADFGEAPMLLTTKTNGTKKDLAVATQKSGFAWALDRDNGNIVWSTEAGPGGAAGGGTWGSATDGKRVYTNIVNTDGKTFVLKPSNKTTTTGGWVAMETATGRILWSTGDPSSNVLLSSSGPVTVANGVVFAGSTNGTGPIYAINAINGQILWSYNTGATIYGGVSVSDGCIYFGHGYKSTFGFFIPTFTPGKTLFAFCVPSP